MAKASRAGRGRRFIDLPEGGCNSYPAVGDGLRRSDPSGGHVKWAARDAGGGDLLGGRRRLGLSLPADQSGMRRLLAESSGPAGNRHSGRPGGSSA